MPRRPQGKNVARPRLILGAVVYSHYISEFLRYLYDAARDD